jgi:radical SAM protein with 4Fe4S-binding SPASM domain
VKRYKRIYVEITNHCNLNCSFCPKNLRPKKFMSPVEFENVAKQIAPITSNICLHLMGEPLLHPKLNEILEIANKYKLQVNLTTNGTLLEQKCEILKNTCIRKLTISLHSYEANQQRISLIDYVDGAIKVAKELTNGKNLIVEFRLWNGNSNGIVAKNSFNEQIIKILTDGFNSNLNIESTQKNYTLAPNVFLGFDNIFVWPEQSKNYVSSKKFCHALRTHFGILCDGTVVPCCLDSEGKIALGNIFETDINTILSSKRATEIYNNFSNRVAVEPLCQKCQFAQKFDK